MVWIETREKFPQRQLELAHRLDGIIQVGKSRKITDFFMRDYKLSKKNGDFHGEAVIYSF